MTCILQNDTIDLILNSYKDELGSRFEQYRNHVYRVYNFAIHSLKIQREINTISIAVAFHDLGIWTNKTFDYIQPSVDIAKQYCMKNSIDNVVFSEIEFIIKEHHKLTKISSNCLAEIFRKADLVDLSLGIIRKNINRKYIKLVKKNFPNKGFHLYLSRLFLKNLLLNPLRPLPMFKF